MKKEVRTVVFDQDLKIEAYRFEGVMQKFPNHFHEHYVVGFIERGARLLTAGNREYTAVPGDLLLFNPRDAHTCRQVDGEALDYRCLNIGTEVMAAAAAEVTGRRFEPFFRERAARGGEELLSMLCELHAMIIEGGCTLKKEELYYVFMGELINNFASEKRPRSAVL